MKLVIVESPSKTKTIKQYLGNDYNVVASKGHIRDIENTGAYNLGLDFNNNFKPIYGILPHQIKTVEMLNEYVDKADEIYLATDPDREGEAISWHLNEVLNTNGKYVKRIEFHEITEPAVLNAIKNPRDIDLNLVGAQETRKIMDRIIGYKLSPILQKRVGSEAETRASAGRVQSACLKLINDREKEVLAFKPKKYYEIEADFGDFKAKLTENGKTKVFDNKEDAEGVINNLSDSFNVDTISYSKRIEHPLPPFVTSTLYQAALTKYNMPSKKTAQIATKLYQGVDINGQHKALITYIRTDSARISDVFKGQLVNHIKNNFGDNYLGYLRERKKTENVQDAHEAIRPVSLSLSPSSVQTYLTPDEYKIYSMIYDQTVESMMKDAEIEVKTCELDNNGYKFDTSFDRTIFPGFKANKGYKDDAQIKIDKGDIFKSLSELIEKETEGPKRYTESSLIKEMEQSGIGRPSTYVSTIETLKSRKYVNIVKKSFGITDLGRQTIEFLEKYFPEFINVKYTANMESTLDEIALGQKAEVDTVKDFYKEVSESIDSKKSKITALETGEVCPNCGSPMVWRNNKFGRFEACSNYPKCKYIKKDEAIEDSEVIICPECHVGHLVPRISKMGKKKGQKFYGCSNYPTCKFTISKISDIKK